MNLSDARPGQVVRIGRFADARTRDQALRFGRAEGTEAVCEQALARGPVVLGRGALKVAIGRRLAGRIAVEVGPRPRGRREG
ncbi:MAG: FeoA domain-containing protein [Bacillota bacterium]